MEPAKPVVLLIDRDLPMLELYQRELSQDYQVLTCADENAIPTLLTNPNLVALVLEPAIASGEGWNLLADILRALQRKPVPVVICSTLDERRRGMEAGAAAFLIKPVSPALLRDTLHQIIRSWAVL